MAGTAWHVFARTYVWSIQLRAVLLGPLPFSLTPPYVVRLTWSASSLLLDIFKLVARLVAPLDRSRAGDVLGMAHSLVSIRFDDAVRTFLCLFLAITTASAQNVANQGTLGGGMQTTSGGSGNSAGRSVISTPATLPTRGCRCHCVQRVLTCRWRFLVCLVFAVLLRRRWPVSGGRQLIAYVVRSERCCYDVVATFPPQRLDDRWRQHQRSTLQVSNYVRQCVLSRNCVRRGWMTQFTVRAACSTYATTPWCRLIPRARLTSSPLPTLCDRNGVVTTWSCVSDTACRRSVAV